jgi:hypothetical protein
LPVGIAVCGDAVYSVEACERRVRVFTLEVEQTPARRILIGRPSVVESNWIIDPTTPSRII